MRPPRAEVAKDCDVDTNQRRRLIEQYRQGPRSVSDAVASMAPADLDRNAGGEPTARQIIHHIADTELVEGLRLRRILSEDRPRLLGVDEAEQARRLHHDRSVESSVSALESVVIANVALLERLAGDEWRRAGTHSIEGSYSVEDWLRKMSQHAHDHAAQVLGAAGRDLISP